MKLEITNIKTPGTLDTERVVLLAKEAVDIGNYYIVDETFDEEGKLSNIGRHVYKFPSKQIAKDEHVVLYTRAKHRDSINEKLDPDNNKLKYHFFYWGREKTVWNANGKDTCTLLEVHHKKTVPVKP